LKIIEVDNYDQGLYDDRLIATGLSDTVAITIVYVRNRHTPAGQGDVERQWHCTDLQHHKRMLYNITSGCSTTSQADALQHHKRMLYNITSGCSTTSQADALRFWKEVPDDYKLFTPRDQQRLWGN
jgi:hypothetical protein